MEIANRCQFERIPVTYHSPDRAIQFLFVSSIVRVLGQTFKVYETNTRVLYDYSDETKRRIKEL